MREKLCQARYRRRLVALAVIGGFSMLAKKMFVAKMERDAAAGGIGGEGLEGQSSYFFENDSVMRSVGGSFSPAKRRVTSDEHSGKGERIELGETADNGVASVGFVAGANLCRREAFGDGN